MDVLIIGAGPAGVMCANALQQAGVRVRIVDKTCVFLPSSRAPPGLKLQGARGPVYAHPNPNADVAGDPGRPSELRGTRTAASRARWRSCRYSHCFRVFRPIADH